MLHDDTDSSLGVVVVPEHLEHPASPHDGDHNMAGRSSASSGVLIASDSSDGGGSGSAAGALVLDPSAPPFVPTTPLTTAMPNPLSSTSSSYSRITPPSSFPSQNGFASLKNGKDANGFASSSASSMRGRDGEVGGGSSRSRASSVVRVNPPGTTIYEDSAIDREEFVRLAIQILKDIGYNESATILEAESGYSLETPRVTEFRDAVLAGNWLKVSEGLSSMGVVPRDLQGARYLVSQQHYLELLEQRLTSRALNVLRAELAPNSTDSDKLHVLSSLMMCSDPDDLRERAKWDGAEGTSRRKLLSALQKYIPTDSMLPERRLKSLIDHAHAYQRSICLYHDPRAPFSLYTDHECSRAGFPTLTTNVLEHDDEVWNLSWSHDGRYLASACKDKKATVWQIGAESSGGRDCIVVQILKDHQYSVSTLAWSLDDKSLVTGSEQHLKMWDVQTGLLKAEMTGHKQGVSAIAVLPDGLGYVSGGMDKEIIFWDANGTQTDEWTSPSMRVLSLAVTPDGTKLVIAAVVDREPDVPNPPSPEQGFTSNVEVGKTPPRPASVSRGGASGHNGVAHHNLNFVDEGEIPMRRRILVYDLQTKEEVFKLPMPKEITSVSISADSRYALINHAPDDLLLLDLTKHWIVRKYTGQQQPEDVIRSCFGGIDEDFILSGSQDSNVYIWRKETGTLVEVLAGHGKGNVNAVAWNPKEVGMFASCSDDHTIRIWEAPPPRMDDLAVMNGVFEGPLVSTKAQTPTGWSAREDSQPLRSGSFDRESTVTSASSYPRSIR